MALWSALPRRRSARAWRRHYSADAHRRGAHPESRDRPLPRPRRDVPPSSHRRLGHAAPCQQWKVRLGHRRAGGDARPTPWCGATGTGLLLEAKQATLVDALVSAPRWVSILRVNRWGGGDGAARGLAELERGARKRPPGLVPPKIPERGELEQRHRSRGRRQDVPPSVSDRLGWPHLDHVAILQVVGSGVLAMSSAEASLEHVGIFDTTGWVSAPRHCENRRLCRRSATPLRRGGALLNKASLRLTGCVRAVPWAEPRPTASVGTVLPPRSRRTLRRELLVDHNGGGPVTQGERRHFHSGARHGPTVRASSVRASWPKRRANRPARRRSGEEPHSRAPGGPG